jgi:hypothetical protein
MRKRWRGWPGLISSLLPQLSLAAHRNEAMRRLERYNVESEIAEHENAAKSAENGAKSLQ